MRPFLGLTTCYSLFILCVSFNTLSAQTTSSNEAILTPEDRMEIDSILKSDVPKSRQLPIETIHAEMLVYLQSLEDEACRNANLNWDGGERRSLRFIRKTLLSNEGFSGQDRKAIKEHIKLIGRPGRPCNHRKSYAWLTKKVLEYYEHNLQD